MYALTKNGEIIKSGFTSFVEAENYWMNNHPTWELHESNEPFVISEFSKKNETVKVEFTHVI